MEQKRIAENSEIWHILILFAVIQIAVLAIVLLFRLPGGASGTIVSEAQAFGYNSLDIAFGYAVYIIAGGAIIWMALKKLNLDVWLFKLGEAVLVIGGVYFLLSILTGYESVWLFLPGFCLLLVKYRYPSLSNACAVLGSVGYGILFSIEFGFGILAPFLILLAIGDWIAVYVTKHMAKMAQELTKSPNALLLSANRRIDEHTISSMRLGSGDAFFSAAFIGSVGLTLQGTALGIVIPLFMLLGVVIALRYLMIQVQKNLRPYPAIPYLAAGLFAGLLLGAVFVVI